MTRFHLLRHADHDWVGRAIAGRMSGVALNARGRAQAEALRERFASCTFDAIYSSPQPRARETVLPFAQLRGLAVVTAEEFDEIDFGAWTGRTLDELQREPAWRHWCERRGSAQPPDGEPFAQVAGRVRAGMERLRRAHPDGNLLVVSHGDVIKALLAGVLRMSLDDLERLEIAPASVSIVDAGEGWEKVALVNATG